MYEGLQKYIDEGKVTTLLPIHEIEAGAVKQFLDVLENDFVKKIAIMPDVHQGYTLPIGGVALTEGIISPAFVGYDIGCGMIHLNLNVNRHQLGLQSREDLEELGEKIKNDIPLGFDRHTESKEYPRPFVSFYDELTEEVLKTQDYQYGTLGGGNHFIEIGMNDKKKIGITIHSGSRKAGHTIGGFYMKKGSYLDLDSEEGQNYLKDMNWALQYALDNRLEMLRSILLNMGDIDLFNLKYINENHNHAVLQDNNMVLHRKGATPSDKNQYGIVPGNMFDGTYITVGLGNEEYLSSASHGAGRVMSRNKAKKASNKKDVLELMKDIVCVWNKVPVDEGRHAYKDIHEVIARQNGVVFDTFDYFKPIMIVKG